MCQKIPYLGPIAEHDKSKGTSLRFITFDNWKCPNFQQFLLFCWKLTSSDIQKQNVLKPHLWQLGLTIHLKMFAEELKIGGNSFYIWNKKLIWLNLQSVVKIESIIINCGEHVKSFFASNFNMKSESARNHYF